jgi:hypothetical protein
MNSCQSPEFEHAVVSLLRQDVISVLNNLVSVWIYFLSGSASCLDLLPVWIYFFLLSSSYLSQNCACSVIVIVHVQAIPDSSDQTVLEDSHGHDP